MRFLLGTLFTILIFLLIGTLAISLLVFWSAGLSWLLIKLLPLTLFEGALLILLATIFVLYVAVKMLSDIPRPDSNGLPPAISLSDDDAIPDDRFWQSADEKTNEAWFRYAIANELYEDISDMELDLTLGKAQQKELAIRLTDIVVAVLKVRNYRKNARRVAITLPQLKEQMEKLGQRPYDDDILETAVSTVNIRLSYDEELVDIVINKTWNEIDPDW
jgi:hypothetical protein